MRNLARILAVALVSLLVFVAAALTAQVWLQRQAQQLRAETVAAKRAELARALPLVAPAAGAAWDQPALQKVGALLDAEVVLSGGTAPAPATGSRLSFSYRADPQTILVVAFPTPPAHHLIALYQHALALLLLLALALFLLTSALAIIAWLRPAVNVGHTRDSLAVVRSEMNSLARLAQASAAQNTALLKERGERQRAEEDSRLRQKLLGHAQEEKVQLGRDLHDGLIQSLYATGLMLESARTLLRNNNGPAAEHRLAKALEALNAVIRDVRNYIQGLAPERLQRSSFNQALQALAEELGAGREAKFDIQLDDEAAILLNADQTADALQIAREAISNSLRHGHASTVTLRLHRGEREVCLLVQDDGAGFDPDTRETTGHGTDNMQARAARLGAELRVTSRPGTGTRVLLNMPILQPA